MSTQPLQQAMAATREVLANVTAEQMEMATPCASWDVRGVVNHVIGGNHFFAAGMSGQAPSGGDVDYTQGDWMAAYDEATSAFLACAQEEGAMEKMVTMPFGEMPGAAVVGLAMTDTFTHGWDLAKATGQSTDLAPELAGQLLAQSRQMIQPAFRTDTDGTGPFMAEQACADGACNADQLAAFLGREV